MAKTGLPELDAIIAGVGKKFGKEFGNVSFPDPTPIPTGSAMLDSALRIGGVPRGRITEIFGEESSGKTSLALSIVTQAQKIRKLAGLDKRDLLIDLEHSLTKGLIEGIGLDPSIVIWERPDTAEEALQIAIDYPKSGLIDCVLFDSVDAAQNERQLGRTVGDDDVGGISKEMNFAMRQLCKIATQTNTTYLFINQIKMNPGKMYGNPEVTPGGKALAFYASVRLKMMSGKPSPNAPNAMTMRTKIIKTKVGDPYGSDPVEFDFIYAKGVDPVIDLIGCAKSLEILRFAGVSAIIKWPNIEEEETVCTGGKPSLNLAALLRENSALAARLREACLTQAIASHHD